MGGRGAGGGGKAGGGGAGGGVAGTPYEVRQQQKEVDALDKVVDRAHNRLVYASAGSPRAAALRDYNKYSKMLKKAREKLAALQKKHGIEAGT